MKKGDKGLAELTKVCNEALRISKKYSYLWDDEDIWGKKNPVLYIAWGFIAQDESFSIYIARRGKKFVFEGNNFCYNHEGYGAREAALTIKNCFGNYTNMDAGSIKEYFYFSLKEVLGKYIAKKEIEKMKF